MFGGGELAVADLVGVAAGGVGEPPVGGIHDFRKDAIAEAINDWSDDDRAALARLLPRFVDDFGALTTADR